MEIQRVVEESHRGFTLQEDQAGLLVWVAVQGSRFTGTDVEEPHPHCTVLIKKVFVSPWLSDDHTVEVSAFGSGFDALLGHHIEPFIRSTMALMKSPLFR